MFMKNGCVNLLELLFINLTMTKYKVIAKVIYFDRSCKSPFLQEIRNQSVLAFKHKIENGYKMEKVVVKIVVFTFSQENGIL